MKNLLNRVLVVLAISAVFAGNIDAAVKGAKVRAATPATPAEKRQMQIQKSFAAGEFINKAEEQGDKTFGQWKRLDRSADIEEQYGSITAAPKSVVDFLIGQEGDSKAAVESRKTANRAKHKKAALEIITNSAVKDAKENLEGTSAALEKNPADEKLQAQALEQESMLQSLIATGKSYITPKTLTAAAVTLATFGALYYDIFGVYTFLQPRVGGLYDYLASTRVGGVIGSGVGMAKTGLGKAWAYGPAQVAAGVAGVYQTAKGALGYGAPVVVAPKTVVTEIPEPEYQ